MVNIKRSISFTFGSNEQIESEFKNTMQFALPFLNKKWLVINLIKSVHLYEKITKF